MGTSTGSTVDAAELRGIVLAFQIALDVYASTTTPGECTVFMDNQAAIQATAALRTPSGQYILIEAIRALDTLHHHGWKIQIRWIPPHIGVPGNEAADQPAKEAAGRDPTAQPAPELQHEPDAVRNLIAAAESTIRQAMRDELDQNWERAKHGREPFRLGMRPRKGTLPHI